MAKLLKHFGFGGKKSPAHQPLKPHYDPQKSDSVQGLKYVQSDQYGTESKGANTTSGDSDIRRSNSEYARTLQTSGEFGSADATREHNWSLRRGRISKHPINSPGLKGKQPSNSSLHVEEGAELTVTEDDHSTSSMNTDTTSQSNTLTDKPKQQQQQQANKIPLSDDYSSPYDLNKQTTMAIDLNKQTTTAIDSKKQTTVAIDLNKQTTTAIDLNKQTTMAITSLLPVPEVEVMCDTTELPLPPPPDQDSVPYNLKYRLKGLNIREPVQEQEHATPGKVFVAYDDPYEESPIIPISSNFVRLVVQPRPTVTSESLAKPLSCQQMIEGRVVVGGNFEEDFFSKNLDSVRSETPPPPSVPAKFYQLSAEYGGIEVKNVDNNDDDDDDDDNDGVGNYHYLQEDLGIREIVARPAEVYSSVMVPPVARHARVFGATPLGAYDKPWDLSTTQKAFEDRAYAPAHGCKPDDSYTRTAPGPIYNEVVNLSVSSCDPRNRVGSTHAENLCHGKPLSSVVVDGEKRRETSLPVYGVPRCIKAKDGKRNSPVGAAADAVAMTTSADGRGTSQASGSAGEKAAVPIRSSSLRPIDLRPTDDYDEPWDEKKKMICKTVSNANVRPVTTTSTQSSNQIASFPPSWNTITIDTQLPLEKQPWYHATISRVDAENLLRIHREGSYLIRNSESNKKDYSLSVKSTRGFMHMKIVTNAEGRFILGQFSQPFYNIAQMILHYTVHKLPIKGAEHMSLVFPITNKSL